MAAEMLCHNYRNLYNVPFTVLRYGVPYGPRMREELLIPVFLKKALAGEPLTITGSGEQYRTFVYVKDLAEAHLLAMQEQAMNQTYNLEGPRKVTVLEVAQRVKALIGEHVQIEWVPDRPGDFGGKEVSGRKAKQELDWEPVTDFEQGFTSTGQWFCDKWGQPLRKPLVADTAQIL